jgi:ribosomal protein L34
MTVTKSRKFKVDGVSYVATFDKDKNLNGISKTSGRAGQKRETPINPSSSEFANVLASDEALNAYNVNRFKGKATTSTITKASVEELNNVYNQKTKKNANESSINQEDVTKDQNVAARQNASPKSTKSEVLSYPFDLNPRQDHFKIMRYNYIRPDINMSKGPDTEIQLTSYQKPSNSVRKNKTGFYNREINRAGDSVIGSEFLGSVLLPMPKATDVNGVEWGKSELTISGIAALGAANAVAGRLANDKGEAALKKEAKEALNKERGRNEEGTAVTEFARAFGVQTVSKLAGAAFGTELDADTFLARTGGKVLNPNAEMLFQGPVIRDFAFSFLMVARSQKEGERIRKIIRFLKLGMAPKFRSTTFLKAPDIFTLHYKNGIGERDVLKTVNLFNPGGLALTTMNVDYAPFGYWSAYRDSQPVAVKMDLNFTELRPLYQSDQLETPEDSVGY